MRMTSLADLFPVAKPIIGMVHCRPLPGSPRYNGEPMTAIIDQALQDAFACVTGGMDGLMIENHGDIPFLPPGEIGMETVAAMTAVVGSVVHAVGVPIGINILANGAMQAMAVAKATGAQFIRANLWVNAYVANEGLVEAAAPQVLRFRQQIHAAEVRVFADVHVKHGSHAIVADRTLAEQTKDVEFFDADVLIVTGQRTGDAASIIELRAVKQAASMPVILGSGVTAANVALLLGDADGAIVGSWTKEEGHWSNPVSQERVVELMKEVKQARMSLTKGA
jgi:membrane complex biogenesis BtpA family protein